MESGLGWLSIEAVLDSGGLYCPSLIFFAVVEEQRRAREEWQRRRNRRNRENQCTRPPSAGIDWAILCGSGGHSAHPRLKLQGLLRNHLQKRTRGRTEVGLSLLVASPRDHSFPFSHRLNFIATVASTDKMALGHAVRSYPGTTRCRIGLL
jgi:hypothetical protein